MRTYVEPQMAEGLAGHVLELHVDTPQVKGWYMKRPGAGRMMSTLILFTREGIVVFGDLCPKQNGVISTLGYGEDWFAGRLSEDYLCEKFLHREFVLENAIAELRERIIESRRSDAITKAAARRAMDSVKYGGLEGPESIYDVYGSAKMCTDDLGSWYNPVDAGWLCAIQQRFSALMQQNKTEVAA